MITIEQRGSDLRLSGPGKSKDLHVTPAKRCADWLKYELDPDTGHQTLKVRGLTDLAKSLGFDKLEDRTKPEPLSKDEEAKLAALSAKKAKAEAAQPKPSPKPTAKAEDKR